MKASIILINYNDKTHIERAILSSLNQTWKDTEVIVVDDGSDQETREIYKKFDAIKLVQLERNDMSKRTPSRARNAGFEASTGDYIAFLDSDNYYAHDFIETCMKDSPADCYFVNWEILGLHNQKIDIEKVWKFEHELMENYLKFQHLDHQCLLTKRELLSIIKDKSGYLYDTRLPRSQDCDLIVRLLKEQCEWRHVPKRLFYFEKHETDQTKSYASIHGKTLWTLKNDINFLWLMAIIQRDPMLVASFYRAINDFMTLEEWHEDYKKSAFKNMYEYHSVILSGEKSENVSKPIS